MLYFIDALEKKEKQLNFRSRLASLKDSSMIGFVSKCKKKYIVIKDLVH